MSLKFSVLLSAVVATLGASTYNYDRCDIIDNGNGYGPLFWGLISGSKCGTVLSPQSEGTPVNLCNAVAFSGTAPTAVATGYGTSRTMGAANTGSSLYWYVNSNAPTLQIGSLATTVGRATGGSTETWILEQIHPHWGRDGLVNEGSEHYIAGTAYPMEVHLVHYNSKYANFSAAVGTGNNADALLVVGVMLTIGTTDLPIITALANQISSLTQSKTTLSSQVQVSDFYDGTGSYFSYKGGLTTPGCLEIVTWVVMKGTKTITLDTLNKFKAATINPATASSKFDALATAGTYGTYGNYRPLQPITGRTIYSSDGATGACTTFTEAQATCTSGVLFSGPSVVIQLVALALAILASRE